MENCLRSTQNIRGKNFLKGDLFTIYILVQIFIVETVAPQENCIVPNLNTTPSIALEQFTKTGFFL